MAGTSLQFKDKQLAYQPYQDIVRKFTSLAQSKNIARPFSTEGFDSVLQNPTLSKSLVSSLGTLFQGTENYQKAYESCVTRAFREHSNPFTGYFDADGNEMNFGAEGYGATAVTGGYNTWTRLAPVLTAGYLARSRALEAYLVINDDKPTFWRQYTVDYMQKGLNGERLIMPKAIRSGKVAGMYDLPFCEPVVPEGDPNTNLAQFDTDSGKKVTMIKVGTTGNLMDQSQFPDGTPINKTKHALERVCSIDWIRVSFKTGETTGTGDNKTDVKVEKLVRVRIERDLMTGKSSERLFNKVVNIPYTVNGKQMTRVVRVAAFIDLDTGYYQVMADGSDEVTHVHFKVRVTNVANEMETYMSGQDNYTVTFDIENKLYGSIPIIPEMTADYNQGGDGVSWVAYMTNRMTEHYAGIRDNDLENFIDSEYDYSTTDFELALKLGGFKYDGVFPMIARHPGGSDDIMAPVRMMMKYYLTRLFTRTEHWTNFDNDIERQWIIFARDEDVDVLPDVSWVSDPNAVGDNGEGTSGFRFGFSLDDAYGFMDNFRRKVRVNGSKDERWDSRPLWAICKSMTLAAPTSIYFPYMFRVFSGISPDMRNRPAMLFASRDAKHISAMVQARITLEGNDMAIWQNNAAFAAGQFPTVEDGKNKYPYAPSETSDLGPASAIGENNIPDYRTSGFYPAVETE